MCDYDTVIIGGGAAGLFAGIFAGRAARAGTRIAVLDGAKKVGAKILVAGGGRCNVTHDVVTPDDYAGASRNAIARVLRTFTVEQTTAFFAELGVRLKREETGKLFPTTDRARTVLDALLKALRDGGAELLTDHRVTQVERAGDRFMLTTSQGGITADRVILATGGKALPKTGSDGTGYRFAAALGHTVTDTTPALVPLVVESRHWITGLSGIAVDVMLTVTRDTGKVVHRQEGAMLFTHFGVSGPAAMDISRHWLAMPGSRLLADFTRGQTFEQVQQWFVEQAKARPRATLAGVLTQWVPDRVGRALCEHAAGVDPATALTHLSRDARRSLAHALTACPLPIVRDRGYLFAEVTAGGVPLAEVDLATMASRRCPGLYLCGEILDVDGRIGGYNFQWAWCSGRLAGLAAASAAAEAIGSQS